MVLENCSMTLIAEKLAEIGGVGPLKVREWRIRSRLDWHRKAQSAIRHLLYGERRPTFEEAREIEAAHLRFCAERLRQNAAENEALVSSMRSALDAMESADAEFFRPHIEATRALLLLRRNGVDQACGED